MSCRPSWKTGSAVSMSWYTCLYTGRSWPETHPELSSLLRPGPWGYCAECAPSAAAENRQTKEIHWKKTEWGPSKLLLGHQNWYCCLVAGRFNIPLTLYRLALICSTWNFLGQLHWDTCRLTCRRQHHTLSSQYWAIIWPLKSVSF